LTAGLLGDSAYVIAGHVVSYLKTSILACLNALTFGLFNLIAEA